MSVYARVGESLQQIGGDCPEGWVVMTGERPTPDHTASPEGSWELTVDRVRQRLTAENNAAYEAAIGALTADYPAAEIATWERQRAEALAWAGDPQADTPWIDIAAAARQLDREVYLTRTLAKVNAFAQASAYLTGRRQGIDDAIRAAATAEELAAVVIDYTLPGAP